MLNQDLVVLVSLSCLQFLCDTGKLSCINAFTAIASELTSDFLSRGHVAQ